MFRFMIRDVLWLTLVVALLLSGWADRHRAINGETQVNRLTETVERQRAKIQAQKEMNARLTDDADRMEEALFQTLEAQGDHRLDSRYPIYYPPQLPKP